MRPDTSQPSSPDPRTPVSTARDTSRQTAAVANMTRDQIAAIYANQAATDSIVPQQQPANPEPAVQTAIAPDTKDPSTLPAAYARTHQQAHTTTNAHWEQYHSQWQKYYQQYYEQYYVGAIQQTHTAYHEHAAKLQEQLQKQSATSVEMTEDEALHDLRSQLLGKVQANTKKMRRSKHFIPALSAITVLFVFLFLQYNATIFAYLQAYISPGNMDPQNIIIDPNASLAVGPEPKLIIPKINVDIAVDYTAKPDNDSQMAAMKTSVAYFGIAGANSKPGELGNTPMAGHSSNDFTDSGAAKFIFARLDQLQKGDIFYLNYSGTRYTYSISNIMVVKPNEVTKLQVGQDKPYATLITCTPLGTAEKRLLVFGEQISPSPQTAKVPAQSNVATATPSMAGKNPTLVERLFGAQ